MKSIFLLSNTEIKKELGNLLRKHRIELGYSQNDLAKKSGVSVHSISNIENGNDFTIENFLNILRALDLLESFSTIIPDVASNPYDIISGINERKRVRGK